MEINMLIIHVEMKFHFQEIDSLQVFSLTQTFVLLPAGRSVLESTG